MAETDKEKEMSTDPDEADANETNNDESFDLDGGSDENVDLLFDEAMDADDGDDEGEEEGDAEEDELDESDSEDDDEANEDDAEKDNAEEDNSSDKPDGVSESTKTEETGEKPDAALVQETAKRVALETQVKKTLEALGIKVDGSVTEALEKAAAEAEGVPLDEYRKKNREEIEVAAAREQIRRNKFEGLATRDLSELKKSFPAVLEKGHIRDCFDSLEDFAKFGVLRDAGIGAKEAYLAVNGDKVLSAQTKAAQEKAAADNKGHIKSAVPKGATDETVVMPKEDLKVWRELFPDKTYKERRKLYRETL